MDGDGKILGIYYLPPKAIFPQGPWAHLLGDSFRDLVDVNQIAGKGDEFRTHYRPYLKL